MRLLFLAAALAVSAGVMFGQDKPPDQALVAYKVDYTIREGAAPKARRYSLILDGAGRGSFRVGHRVPYTTGSFQPGTGSGTAPMVATQWNYMDAGVNIDARLREVGGKIALHTDVEISVVDLPEKGTVPVPPAPTVASVRFNVDSVLLPGKPLLIGSIDDPVTQRRFEVEAVVTRQN